MGDSPSKIEAEEKGVGGDTAQVGHEDEGRFSEQLPERPLKQPETLRRKRGRPRKQKAEEIGGGERVHAGQENDTGLNQTDQLGSALKLTNVLPRKRGRGRPRKMQADQDMKDEEQGGGGNGGNKSDISPNQSLRQLPKTSMEMEVPMLPQKRGRPRKTHIKGHGGERYESCLSKPQPEHYTSLPEGISSRCLTRSLKAHLDQCAAASTLLNSPVRNVKTTPAGVHHHLTMGISSPEIAFASESRRLTRNMKAYLDQCLARSAPLRSAVRNVMNSDVERHDNPNTMEDISAAQCSSYHVKNQGLGFAPNSLTCPNLQASALPSETDISNTSALNEPAADLLAQSYGSGDVCRADPSDVEHIVDNYQPAEGAYMPSNFTINTIKETASMSRQSGACPSSRSVTLNLTQMCSLANDNVTDFDEVGSRVDESLVPVNGYQVKAEVAPILRDIFFRYGDIAKDCIFHAVKSRSSLIENVCGIYKKLEGTNFLAITSMELNSLLEEVRDLETVKIEVGWLRYRLDEILVAKKGFKSLKDEKIRITQATERRRQVLAGYNKELKDCKKALEVLTEKIHEEENALAVEEEEEERLNQKFTSMKSTLKGFYQKSLVHGLL